MENVSTNTRIDNFDIPVVTLCPDLKISNINRNAFKFISLKSVVS